MPWEADFETGEGKGRKQEWAKGEVELQCSLKEGPAHPRELWRWDGPSGMPQVGLGGWPAVRGLGHSAKAVHEKH